ncbi:MAG: glutamate ABC transporter permease [Candidatus Rokuibacteriota bacterium]|nr:MAG: glutamate ABC transporter permease [Candidatus Rokubacteria bacterium]
MRYAFHWEVLWSGQSGRWLLQGLATTVELSALGWVLAAALGIVSGAMRTVPWRPLRALATVYVEFFRNVPLLVWMFFWYFGVPPLLPEAIREWLFRHGAEFWAGTFALGVYHGARMSEVIRGGIQAIPRTQFEAAVAMGLTTFQAYRLVIVPIALRLSIPPATNESLNLLKNSSVALTISVAELTFQTRQIEAYTARALEALTAGTVIYLVLCVGIAAIMARVEHRFAIPGLIARGG